MISNNPLKGVQDNLGQAQIDFQVLEAQISALQASLSDSPKVPGILVDRQVDQRPEIQQTVEQLNQKRALLSQIAVVAAEATKDPKYRKVEQEIEQLESTLASLRTAHQSRVREEMEALASLDRMQQLDTLQTQLSTQSLIVDSLRANHDDLVKDLAKSGGHSLDLRMKQRDLDRRQAVLDRIADRAAELTTEMYAPQRVEPIQEATVPQVPIELLPWKALLAAVLASCCLPFGLCALWERSVQRVTSIDQLRYQASLPVIGEIARLPSKMAQRPDASRSLDYELGVFEESIDSLRTGLVLSHAKEEMRIVAVCQRRVGRRQEQRGFSVGRQSRAIHRNADSTDRRRYAFARPTQHLSDSTRAGIG